MLSQLSPLLIANRGEIAERIVRTAKRLGIRTIVIYSDADRDTLAVHNADLSIRIGAAQLSDSYLNAEKIIAIAKTHGAKAIHPGYGLLSENSEFASEVLENELIWVGPSPQSMRKVAGKANAKDVAKKSNVPVVPGYQGEQSRESFCRVADEIGYPILLKAVAGGGGRGIRKAHNEKELLEQFEIARSEAENSFGDSELLLEKLIPQAHHVEVQVFGDAKGNVVHLGERDCSAQRRNQKVIEEAPSPSITFQQREEICAAAVRIASAAKYTNAGTVEFLVTPEGKFYFLEMNTRLQVEHPVTELVTGLDLVEWQLRIAAGEALPLQQKDIHTQGHAIQLRLYAEDPYNDYRPQTGRVTTFLFPKDVRADHFLCDRTTITPFYDSMLAKIIVHGDDRNSAIESAVQALDQTIIAGLVTNREFLKEILRSDFFSSAKTLTTQLDKLSPERTNLSISEQNLGFAIATLIFAIEDRGDFDHFQNWSNTRARRSLYLLQLGQRTASVDLSIQTFQENSPETSIDTKTVVVKIENTEFKFILLKDTPDQLTFNYENRIHHIPKKCDGISAHFNCNGKAFSITNSLRETHDHRGSNPLNSNTIAAVMDGTLVKVLVRQGDIISSGQVLAIIEAMKMQMELRAPRDGRILAVHADSGQQVRNRQLLIELVPLTLEKET